MPLDLATDPLVIRLQQINRLKGVARPEIFEEDE